MHDTITICTSDDPPVRLEASRTILAANSKVFADMLSVPTKPGSSSSIDLAEKEVEIKPFLRILNMSHDEGDPLNELEPEDWPVVAKLADKYDSAAARALAKWSSRFGPGVDGDSTRAAAFKTAATLGHAAMTKAFLFDVLEKAATKQEVNKALRGRRPQFNKWADQAKDLAFKMSLGAGPAFKLCAFCDREGLRSELTWMRATHEALSNWQPFGAAKPFCRAAMAACDRSDLCPHCQNLFMFEARRFEAQYRTDVPDFPH
ncbi:hypothetical protein JCM9279_002927 [Rhodotorula babjevae]